MIDGNKHKQTFVNAALKLDAISSSNGAIAKCALEIAETVDAQLVFKFCGLLKIIANSGDDSIKKLVITVKDSFIYLCGYEYISSICNKNSTELCESELTFDQLMAELNSLIGLSNVKSKVSDLIAFQKIQKLRREKGLPASKSTLHLSFTGNPGTGKTTVARIVGRLYKKLGLLSKGHFIEVSRTDLIAGYQGQTAIKVKNVIEKARGGVLFIDEAYSITENEHTDSYGRECLTELTKALEDYREDLVVIVAGYTEPMKAFFESNPGLKSRINTFIEFDDYCAGELCEILHKMCNDNQYVLDSEACAFAKTVVECAVANKGKQFANGRFIRNLFEDLIISHAKRVANINQPTMCDLTTILKVDFVQDYCQKTQ